MNRNGILALATVWLIATGSAQASIIFDNYKGPGASQYVEETRNANFTFGTVLNVTQTTTISGIEFRWRPNDDMNVTIGIFDSQLGGNFGSVNWSPVGNNLLFSQTLAVTAVAGPVDYYISTGPMSFTFLAGHRYDIGLVGDAGTLTGSWDIQNGYGQINTVQNGFESINANANLTFSPFRSDYGYASVDPHIRLSANAVPAPAGLVLAGLAAPALGLIRRRKFA